MKTQGEFKNNYEFMKYLLNNMPRSGPSESLPQKQGESMEEINVHSSDNIEEVTVEEVYISNSSFVSAGVKGTSNSPFIINVDNVSGSENKNMGRLADLESAESEATATLTVDEMEITNDMYINFAYWLLFSNFPLNTFSTIFSIIDFLEGTGI